MFSTILVPLDGSAESNVALPLARAVARAKHGSIWLLRVASDAVLAEDHSALHIAAQSVERIAGELAGCGVQVHPVAREGDAAREVLHLSEEIHADVIVMRTHGRAGLERAVFGSVAEEVLKKTSVPLILVRPGGRRVTRIHKLLVPVDGSPLGQIALDTADAMAQATGASIQIVQVVVPIPIAAYAAPYDPGGAGYYDPAWDDNAVAAARTYVAGVGQGLRERGHAVEGEAQTAHSVAECITRTAETGDADLIVMSTHALTGPARAILGSVADAVVRSSLCPVLLIKRPDRDTRALNVIQADPPC
jgi:nucleotide-binding universal stress UspA family protein